MLVTGERSSWCNRVDNFWYQFGIGGREFLTVMDWYEKLVKPIPLQDIRSLAMSFMVVKCERFRSFLYKFVIDLNPWYGGVLIIHYMILGHHPATLWAEPFNACASVHGLRMCTLQILCRT